MTAALTILAALVLAAGVRRGRVMAANRATIPEGRAREIDSDPTTAAGDMSTESTPKWSHTFDDPDIGNVTISTYDEWMTFMESMAGAGADGMTEADGAALAELMMWGNSTFKAWER